MLVLGLRCFSTSLTATFEFQWHYTDPLTKNLASQELTDFSRPLLPLGYAPTGLSNKSCAGQM